MSNYKTVSEIDSIKEIKEILENNQPHRKCFTKIFMTNNISIQKNCLKKKQIFFPLNQNKFIHIKCNRLIVDKLENLKSKQTKIFQNEIQ